MRTRINVDVHGRFLKARLPKGTKTLNPRLVSAIDRMHQKKLSTSAGCTIVFFKGRGGGYKAVQRCDNRSMKNPNSAFVKNARKRVKGPNKVVCRCKTKSRGCAHKGMFKSCARGRH